MLIDTLGTPRPEVLALIVRILADYQAPKRKGR